MAAPPTGRLVLWTERDRADWIAHNVDDGFILLEPVSERARREMARYPTFEYDPWDSLFTDGWLCAEWWDSPLEQAVAREIANGWNVTTPPTGVRYRASGDSEGPFDSWQFGRMLAAILHWDEAVGWDEVTDEAAREALQIAERS